MRTDLPAVVQSSLHDLTVDPFVHLYKLVMSDGTTFRLSKKGNITWQTFLYEGDLPCDMSSVSQSSDAKMSRPKFTVVNPLGLFGPYVNSGVVDNATVTRYRVLYADIKADRDFKIIESFRVSRILSLTKDILSLELRDVLDGTNFLIPARTFIPPDFTYVRLQ